MPIYLGNLNLTLPGMDTVWVGGNQVYSSMIPMPSKGQLITMDLGNGNKQYRVLNTEGNIAFCLAMYEANSSQVYWNTNQTTSFNGTTGTKYAGSDLDNYLNSTWYSGLSDTAKNAIIPTNINQKMYKYYDEPNTRGGTPKYTYQYQYDWDNNDWDNADYIGQVSVGNRYVFALEVDDIFDYIGGREITSNELMTLFFNTTKPSSPYTYPWLRSADAGNSNSAWNVLSSGGNLNGLSVNRGYAARPGFHIDLSKIAWA